MAPHLTPPRARVAGDEDEASGFASMVADLVGANLADSQSRALVSRLTRGDVVLTATDNGQSVTVSFKPGEVVVSDEERSGAPVMAGSWLVLANVCTGTRSPFDAIRTGDVRVSKLSRPDLLGAAGFVLSAPREEPIDQRRALLVALVVLVVLVIVVAAWRSR